MADVIKYTNDAKTLLATSINTAATSIVGVSCAAFPSPTSGQIFYATLTDNVQAAEIVKVTARSTNTLTVVRAQEGTTAKSWTLTSTTVRVNITAASLNQFAQNALNTGNARGANALDYQSTRTLDTQVASGANSVALGSNNTASGSTAVAIGVSTAVSGTNSVGIGNSTTVAGSNSVGLGELAVASGNTATAAGYAATASNTNASAYGRSTVASGAQALAAGYNAAAAGTDGTAAGASSIASGVSGTALGRAAAATVGANATAVGSGAAASRTRATAIGANAIASTQDDTTAVGSGSAATNFFGTALGYSSLASGVRSVSVGDSTSSGSDAIAFGSGATASGASSFAMGNPSTASGTLSYAIGGNTLSRRNSSLSLGVTRVLSPDLWNTGAEYGYNTSNDETVYSSYLDLTGGLAWATATLYNHGHVVRPIVANGFQYWLWTSNTTSITTAGAEPTWPTTHGSSVSAGSGAYWICINAANYPVTLPTGIRFFPKAVGFLVERYDTVTVQPSISFGETGNLVKYLAATTTTKLTAAFSIEEYTALASYVGGTTLTFTLQTAATGTRLLGRAFWTGKFIDVAV